MVCSSLFALRGIEGIVSVVPLTRERGKRMSMSPNRRGFLKGTAAVAAATGLPEWFLKREAQAAEATAGATAAPATQPKLPVALVGCGGRGTYVCEKDGAKHLQVVAVCAVDQKHAESVANRFKGAGIYSDFRKVMERKDIKAIVNGTPDHWHTPVNIHPLRPG